MVLSKRARPKAEVDTSRNRSLNRVGDPAQAYTDSRQKTTNDSKPYVQFRQYHLVKLTEANYRPSCPYRIYLRTCQRTGDTNVIAMPPVFDAIRSRRLQENDGICQASRWSADVSNLLASFLNSLGEHPYSSLNTLLKYELLA